MEARYSINILFLLNTENKNEDWGLNFFRFIEYYCSCLLI